MELPQKQVQTPAAKAEVIEEGALAELERQAAIRGFAREQNRREKQDESSN